MKCMIIQQSQPGRKNAGEIAMLQFLTELPVDSYVFRELRITDLYKIQMLGYVKIRPDFVVVRPELGVMSIETKDWNLSDNIYSWQDQDKVLKTRRQGGQSEELANPTAQAEKYFHALSALLRDQQVFISSIVAFPLLTRAEFRDGLDNIEVLENPQTRLFLDLEQVIFKEDIDRYRDRPSELLLRIASRHPKHFRCSAATSQEVAKRLLPPAFNIGSATQRQEARHGLEVLSEKQKNWVFHLKSGPNYLLDVAGSGKSNALVSRAIHLVSQATAGGTAPSILITTYSHNLETSLKRILANKLAGDDDQQVYNQHITVLCMPCLLERIICSELAIDDLATYRTLGESGADYEKRLRSDIKQALTARPEAYRQFDAVFIDEIQDFDDFDLIALKRMCRGNDYFFVGDLCQKILDRQHNLSLLGFNLKDIELPRTYQMHRTPKFVAELAVAFVRLDPGIAKELADAGYGDDFQPRSPFHNLAQLRLSSQPEPELAKRAASYINAGRLPGDLLVVTSTQKLEMAETALRDEGLATARGEAADPSVISVVDFTQSKGLEREIVLMTGIEDLYVRGHLMGLFWDADTRYYHEQLSRRQVYVALTRTIEEVIVYYRDPMQSFITDLMKLNADIQARLMPVP